MGGPSGPTFRRPDFRATIAADGDAINRWLVHMQPVAPNALRGMPMCEAFDEVVKRSGNTSTGPAGNAAKRRAGRRGDARCSAWPRRSWQECDPRLGLGASRMVSSRWPGALSLGHGEIAAVAGELLPLSLMNTNNKLVGSFAHVVSCQAASESCSSGAPQLDSASLVGRLAHLTAFGISLKSRGKAGAVSR